MALGSLLNVFKSKDAKIEAELLAQGFEKSECDFDCGTCSTKFPNSVKIQDDSEGSLWETSKPYGLQVIIPTGKTDWPHDAYLEEGKLPNIVSNWAEKSAEKFPGLGSATNIKVSVSSLCTPELNSGNEEHANQTRGDLLLLPFFVWVRNVTVEDVAQVLDEVIPILLDLRDKKSDTIIEKIDNFPEVTFEISKFQSYIFLCSHRTRDKLCGITAPIMKKEMEIHLRDLDLHRDEGDDREGGVQVSYVNHIGGHKYGANVIIYLRKSGKNIWLGRCRPNNVQPIIDECILGDGKVWPEKLRLTQRHNPIEW